MRKSVAKWMLLTTINTNETYEMHSSIHLHPRDVAQPTRADLRPQQTEKSKAKSEVKMHSV